MTRRVGQLDTPKKVRKECVRLYRDAWEGKIPWVDAANGAAVLSKLFKMIAVNGDDGEDFGNVGKNALRH